MTLVEMIVDRAAISGTPPQLVSIKDVQKVKTLRGLAATAQQLAQSVKQISTRLVRILNELLQNDTLSTCTILEMLDPLVEQYNNALNELNNTRRQIDILLSDPNVQSIIKPTDVATIYRAKTAATYMQIIQFTSLPAKRPTVREPFIKKIEQLRNDVEEAKAILEREEPELVKSFFESTEYATIISQRQEILLDLAKSIKDFKDGKISEAELRLQIDAAVAKFVQVVMKNLTAWQEKYKDKVADVMKAKKKKEINETQLELLLRRTPKCEDLKRKYYIIDTPEEYREAQARGEL